MNAAILHQLEHQDSGPLPCPTFPGIPTHATVHKYHHLSCQCSTVCNTLTSPVLSCSFEAQIVHDCPRENGNFQSAIRVSPFVLSIVLGDGLARSPPHGFCSLFRVHPLHCSGSSLVAGREAYSAPIPRGWHVFHERMNGLSEGEVSVYVSWEWRGLEDKCSISQLPVKPYVFLRLPWRRHPSY